MQLSVVERLPSQALPPFASTTSLYRVFDLSPPPQVLLHSPINHELQTQLTIARNDIREYWIVKAISYHQNTNKNYNYYRKTSIKVKKHTTYLDLCKIVWCLYHSHHSDLQGNISIHYFHKYLKRQRNHTSILWMQSMVCDQFHLSDITE